MGTNGSTRKISCLPCRSKKAKCDGQAPCCRCVRNSRENQCIYPKMRTFGRPPKNAVFHTSVTMGTSSRANENLVCREFIFEYDQNTSSNNDKELIQQPNLKIHKDIEEIFSLHLQRGSALREKMLRTNQFISKPRHIKMTGLAQQFSWLGSSMANIAIKRIGQIQLESFHDPEIALSCFIRPEAITRFFYFSQKPMPASDPLNSLPTDNALKLIDYFFQYQPYCILVNKTRLLQEYWDDTADPFLLSVIYGTTLYSSQILEGKPLILYEASEDSKRNPFLNYAYILLEKKLNAGEAGITSTKLSSYQAAVILGVFEVLFGLPKHGMTILSLSYKMATDLGIFDGSLEDMDVISKEQLIMTYWAAFRATSYGCIECKLVLSDANF